MNREMADFITVETIYKTTTPSIAHNDFFNFVFPFPTIKKTFSLKVKYKNRSIYLPIAGYKMIIFSSSQAHDF